VELAGEAVTAGLTVVVLAGSSTLHVGAGAVGRAVLGSLTLGLGVALVLWTFGRICAPQWSPLVSLYVAVMRAQTWGAAIRRVLAQVIGAGSVTLVLVAVVPSCRAAHMGTLPRPALAEAMAAFIFGLVVITVAHYRDGRVPLAVGAVALLTFWTTGEPTLGNPVLLASVAATRSGWRSLPSLLGAAAAGFAAGAAAALLVQPKTRESVRALLFDPRK
jgi:glycerol uptake facilitator-like aquaporin